MKTRKRQTALVGIALATIMGVAACGDDGTTTTTTTGDSGASALSGDVSIDGSSTVAPLSSVAAEEFQGENSDVTVKVGTSGTSGGFEKFCRGEIDIADASRPIKDSEIEACKTAGITYKDFQVANDALTVVVNKENDWVTCLTVDKLKLIWEKDSKVKNWKDIDPSYPDVKLDLFGPGTKSGTFDYFTEEINGEKGNSRTDYEATENDNVIVTGVGGQKGGLGYVGYSYYEENISTLKALQIDNGKGCITPSVETAQAGTYTPLSRPLFIYVADKSITEPQVVGFVKYYVENAITLAEPAKLVPLTTEQHEKSTAALANLESPADTSAPTPASS